MSGTFLAGLRSRKWLNLGVFVLGVLAMVVAVGTALYARASSEHLLDQRIHQRPPTDVGLNVEVQVRRSATPRPGKSLPLTASERQTMLDQVGSLVHRSGANRFWRPPTRYLVDTGVLSGVSATDFDTNIYWREDMCRHAQVQGRCPGAPGEALMQAGMARRLHLHVGDPVTLDFQRSRFVRDRKSGQLTERQDIVARVFTLSGTYRIADPAGPTWFDPGRTYGDPRLRPPTGTHTTEATAPALLVDQSSLIGQQTIAGADRPIDPAAVDIGTMPDAQRALVTWQQGLPTGEILPSDDVVDLAGLFQEVRDEQTLLSRVTLAAVVPLVVLALLLVYVLVSAAAEVRRPHVALAKLRGFTGGRVVRFALGEPALVIALVLPVGAAVAWLGAKLVVRLWLGASTPLVITPVAVASAVVVTLAALAATFVGVLGVVREPLAASLAATTRQRTGSRWLLLGQGGLVMLGLAALVQVVTSRADQSTSLLELLAPLFLSLAVAVLAMTLTTWLAGWWARSTVSRGSVSSYLASRRLVRRGDLVQLVLPLLLAASMASFAASSWKVADDWRVSTASAEVGAATSWFTDSDPARLLRVSHRADPSGRYLDAVVGATSNSEGAGRVALVDTSRFARVLAWDDQWASRSPASVQRLLTPHTGRPVTFSGDHLRVRLTDVHLRARLHRPLELWVRYRRGDTGEEWQAKVGHVRARGSARLSGFVTGCQASACTLEQVYLTGSSESVTDATGRLTVAAIAGSGTRPGDWRLGDRDAWRVARPYGVSGSPPALLTPGPDGLRIELSMRGSPTIARLTTTDLPALPPLVATAATPTAGSSAPGRGTVVSGASILGVRTPMRLLTTTEALPLVGGEGGISDLRSALREYGDEASNVSTSQLLAAAGTPTSVLDKVRHQGVTLSNPRRLAGELHGLRNDAFSLGWKVFLLVGALTLALAFVGVLVLAVVQLRWRSYEVAALRVVGVRRRDLRVAIFQEFLTMLGLAVLLGAGTAVLDQVLVLPSINIGDVGDLGPAVNYAVRWPVIGAVLAAILVGVLLVAWWISWRTVKDGTPASLRQTDPR